jgi:lysozyme
VLQDLRTVLRRMLALLAIAGLALGLSLALALERGWLRLAHPDPARFPARGIDVSHHQGHIDWRAVSGAGIAFAYVKASEGATLLDPRFRDNLAGARAAGLRAGAYHFFTFCKTGPEQARNFLSAWRPAPGDLPPALDVEPGGNCAHPPPREQIVRELRRWLLEVEERTGQRPILYATSDGYDAVLRGAALPHALWLRDLACEPRPGAAIWQFANRARIPGIDAFVDLDAARSLHLEVP